MTFVLFSCKKEPIPTYLTLYFTHTVDGIPLELTTDGSELPYINAAEQNYNIKKLQYLISNISMHSELGNKPFGDHFVDAADPSTLKLELGELHSGLWSSLRFDIGLSKSRNISNAYVNEGFHSTMAWPETMGGGYHYMKIEGNFNNNNTFYNTHTGPTPLYYDGIVLNDWSITISTGCSNFDQFTFNVDDELGNVDIILNMELNQWYESPEVISLTSNGIMEDVNMQMLLQNNGSCIFSNSVNYE
jgi:hypothetical protein